ncbi:hypothetical protein ACLI4U_00610 [Natrialbaceae archaeon A-CW2]
MSTENETEGDGGPNRAAYTEASAARNAWQRADGVINRARVVAEELEGFGHTVDWTAVDTTASTPAFESFDQEALTRWHDVEAALDRLREEPETPRETISFLLEPTLDGETAPLTAFSTGRTVDETVGTLIDALSAYVEGDSWEPVGDAMTSVPTAPGPVADASALFRSIAIAALDHREAQRERVQDAIGTATDEVGDPVTDLDEQPVALLPVDLETRFVDPAMTSAVEDDELWVRVYHDDIHVDNHEPELTPEERRFGKRFWATVWLGAHPNPESVDLAPESAYLVDSFEDAWLRRWVSDTDLGRYSETPAARYDELKSRAWGELVDRLGSERAGYVVHTLAPTDGAGTTLEAALLTPPAESGGDTEGELPPLRFPSVAARTQSWTKQPIARLLPDRWIAVLEWTNADGQTVRKTVAGHSIPDPLPVGPRAELEAEPEEAGETDAAEESDEPDRDGTEWTTDIETAFEVGMAIRIPLTELSGYDHTRGIDRLTVVGAKASMDAAETASALTAQFSSHQYTDGLSLLPAGTPTNVESADPTGALEEDPEAITPPRVADMDLTDGDLLARGLGLDTSNGHPFAHVPGADETGQLDARHANSALWPATLGYALTNLLLPNEKLGLESIWGDDSGSDANQLPFDPDNDGIFGDGDSLESSLAWLDAYRRHFIRYVRSRGPFPTVRVGKQPYGVLPVTATHDPETAIPAVDPSIVQAIQTAELTVEEAESMGVSTAALVDTPEIETKTLLEAGAPAKTLYDHGIEAVELAESGVEAPELREMGATVEDLAERGAPLSTLVQAGFEVVELEAVGAAIEDVLEAGARPQQLARAGLSVAQIAGVDVPADEIIRAGFAARDVVEAGFSVVDVIRGGAPPSTLRDIRLDQSTLKALEAPAGSLRFAGVSAADLLQAGYTASELLNGGFDEKELADTGISVGDLRNAGRTAAELATEGVTVEQLRERGFGPDQLLESGYGQGMLLEAGYTAGELFDAGASVEALVESSADLGALKTAGVSVSKLVDAGADLEALREAGTSADALAAAGIGAERLAEAGYAPKELEAAGLAVGSVAQTMGADTEDEGADESKSSVRSVSVTEAVTRAERDLYGFGFDPATSRTLRARSAAAPKTVPEATDGFEPQTREDSSVDAASASARKSASPTKREADSEGGKTAKSPTDEQTDAPADGDAPANGIEPAETPEKPRRETKTGSEPTDGSNVEATDEANVESTDELNAETTATERSTPVTETGVTATPHVDGSTSKTIAGYSSEAAGISSANQFVAGETVIEAAPGVLEGTVTIPRLTPTDERIADRIESLVMDLRPIWSDAAETLPFGDGQDDWSVLDALERHGVSRSARVDAWIDPQFAPDDAKALESFLKSRELTQFDPRLAHLVLEQAGDGPTVAPYEMVDGQISVFLNLLTAESITDLRTLTFEVDPSVIDPTGFDDPLAGHWDQLPTVGQRAALFAVLEEADDPVGLLEGLLDDDAGVSGEKLSLAASFAANPAYGETGVLRSLARMLFYHGLQREYLEARLRMGVLFDDLPISGPDFTAMGHPFITVFESPYAELLETNAPDELVDAVWGTNRTDGAVEAESPVGDASGSAPITDPGLGSDVTANDVEFSYDDFSETESSAAADDGSSSSTYQGTSFQFDTVGQAAVDTKLSEAALQTTIAEPATAETSTGTGANSYNAVELGGQHEELSEHTLDTDVLFGDPTYADLLEKIADDDATTTALDPRLSEFTDSLAHLQSCEPSQISTLIGESLDLASHRLDAWWTSLATKRLFELRERQRVGEAAFDAWDVDRYDADDVRSRVDPSLLGGLDLEDGDSAGEATASGDEPESDDSSDVFGEARDDSLPEAGLYVGGYGVVTDLKPTLEDSPTYVHTPSEQQATTAALLRSGYLAGEEDDGENLLALDLSPERTQDAKWLIDGVKRGQSLGELLGYRFERRLHEVTVQPDSPNLMQYRQPLREAFPAVLGGLEYAEEAIDPAEAGRRRELARSDVLDGYQLIRHWDDDFFESAAATELPPSDSPAHDELTKLVEELEDDVDAVSDILIAESVHQLGKGNLEDASVSLEALATGAQLPEPTVTSLPRTETGLTHRQLVLLEADEDVADPTTTQLRAVAEPSLEAWAETLLPDPSTVGCQVRCRWRALTTDAVTGEETTTTETAETAVTIADLDLAALDVLALAQDAEQEGNSELEQRIAYYVRRHALDVPADATLELALTEPGEAAVSVAALIEAGRSLSSLIDGGRAADGTDLTHPAETPAAGYDEATLETLTDRGNAVHDRLESIGGLLLDRLPAVGVDGEALVNAPGLEAVEDTPAPTEPNGTADPGGDDSATDDPIDEDRALTTRADAVSVAVETVFEESYVAEIDEALAALEAADITGAFDALASALPAGVTDEEAVAADRIVFADTGQTIRGSIGSIAVPPGVAGNGDGNSSDGDGSSDGDDEDDSDDGSGDDDGSGSGDDGNSGDDDSSDSDDSDGDDSTLTATAEHDYGLGTPSWIGAQDLDLREPRTSVDLDELTGPGGAMFGETVDIDDSLGTDLQDSSFMTTMMASEPDVDNGDSSDDKGSSDNGGSNSDENSSDDDAGSDASGSDDGALETTFDGSTLEVVVWGVSGIEPVWKTATATVENGRFTVTIDFDDVEPGTSLSIAGFVDSTLVYSASGHVLEVTESGVIDDSKDVLEANRDSLGALCWLAAVREAVVLADESGAGGEDGDAAAGKPLATLATALERLDFDAVATTAAETETVSPASADAIAALVDLESVDLAAFVDAIEPVIDVARVLGLDEAFDVIGRDDGHLEARIASVRRYRAVGDVRRRLRRVADDASALEAGVPPRALAYDQGVAAAIESTPEPAVTARALDSLVHSPAWAVIALEDAVDRPALTLARLSAWVFDGSVAELALEGANGESSDDAGDSGEGDDNGSDAEDSTTPTEGVDHHAALVADLRAIAAASVDLEGLFDGVSSDVTATEDGLNALADEIEANPVDASSAASPVDATTTITADVDPAATQATTTRALLSAVETADPDPATALREAVLEGLREPLLAASFAGVYGAVPSAPVGATIGDERTLRTQAVAVLGELDERLLAASALDPRRSESLTGQPLPQQVETQRDRLERLLEDVTVLIPFTPDNGLTLRETFSGTSMPELAGPLSMETWLQRIAQVRDRPATFRDGLSYAEALTGEFHRDLTVGQLPYDPEEPWMGADGVEPKHNYLSLVAQFGPGLEPVDANSRLTALFVDEWVETVPSSTERTGLALQCEDPGNRPPQSVLLALPPEDESWSLASLVGAVTETMTYARLRAVDLDDLAHPAAGDSRSLFPAIYLPNDGGIDRPRTPSVNVDAIDWYDQEYDPSLLDRHVFESPKAILESLETLGVELHYDAEADGGGA